jgi:transcriptional regulator with GAF, ATPase, and Fis domain
MAENADTTALHAGEAARAELVAREIHRESARSERPFLDINCAVLSETLLESEIFGYERGAFTDARGTQAGALKRRTAARSCSMRSAKCPSVQPKLLRVLETRSFRRVGGTKDIPVNAHHRRYKPQPERQWRKGASGKTSTTACMFFLFSSRRCGSGRWTSRY